MLIGITYFWSDIKEAIVEKWTSRALVYASMDGGFPLVIFNEAMDTAVVLSPATTFMSAMQYNFDDPQSGDRILTFGPMRTIDEVNFTIII